MNDTSTSETKPKPLSHNAAFIEFVRDRSQQDNGVRARLSRAARTDDKITSEALWILGAWLPNDEQRALVMARVAGWCATYNKPSPEPTDGTVDSRLGSLGGQLAHADTRIVEGTAERMLESVTRDGIGLVERLNHVHRTLAVCGVPHRINWARLIYDLNDLDSGGHKAQRARIRWYRAYHKVRNFESSNTQPGETPEKEESHD